MKKIIGIIVIGIIVYQTFNQWEVVESLTSGFGLPSIFDVNIGMIIYIAIIWGLVSYVYKKNIKNAQSNIETEDYVDDLRNKFEERSIWQKKMEAKGILFTKGGSMRKGQISKLIADPDLMKLHNEDPLVRDIHEDVEKEFEGKYDVLYPVYIDDFNGNKEKIIELDAEENNWTKKIATIRAEQIPYGGSSYIEEADAKKEVTRLVELGAKAHYEKQDQKKQKNNQD